MIRDRIVVGIQDIKLSLQLNSKLTLEIAVTSTRQAESVHQQQSLLRGEMKQSPSIGSVKSQKKADHPKGKPTQGGHNNGHTAGVTTCSHDHCGKSPSHDVKSCPAKDAICRKCRKRGHYQQVCRSAKVAGLHQPREDDTDDSDAFLGGVSSDNGSPWMITLQLNGNSV